MIKKKYSAFSLIDICVSLAVLGIFFICVVNYYYVISYQNKVDISNRRAKYIQKSIQGYIARNGFLPYSSIDKKGVESSNCCIGFVPYKTLGISSEYLYDGFNKPFKFIVNRNLVLKEHIKNNKLIIPIQLPDRFFYSDCDLLPVSWFRLFYFKSAEYNLISDYDQLLFENIKLYKNGELIKLNWINCNSPFIFSWFFDEDFNEVIKYYEDKKQYKVSDLVAWVLISERDEIQENYDINLYSKNIIYFQTRFNLASQLKKSVTKNGVFLSEEYINYFYLD